MLYFSKLSSSYFLIFLGILFKIKSIQFHTVPNFCVHYHSSLPWPDFRMDYLSNRAINNSIVIIMERPCTALSIIDECSVPLSTEAKDDTVFESSLCFSFTKRRKKTVNNVINVFIDR